MTERKSSRAHSRSWPDSMTAPRYMEIATFMRAPVIEDLTAFDIAVVGVPYDGAVTNRPGARHGPREVRNASSNMRAIHPTTRVNPYELCRIGDGGDVPFTRLYETEGVNEDIEGDLPPLAVPSTVLVCTPPQCQGEDLGALANSRRLDQKVTARKPAHALAVTMNVTCPPYTVTEATATLSGRQLVSRRQHHLACA